jgi:AcrR family transcriptional regulator
MFNNVNVCPERISTMSQTRIDQAAMRLFAERGSSHVSITELAQAAGVARGTIYNNYPAPEALFEEIAARLAADMHDRIAGNTDGPRDPVECLANGLRFFIKQAHDEPHWGRFILRFAFSNRILQDMWQGQPAKDLMSGLESGRYRFAPEQAPSMLAMIAGTGLSAMFLVLQGHKTWRDAGSDAAEFVLRALEVEPEEARRIANLELPPLPK